MKVRLAAILVVTFGAAACSPPPPFVYREDEFDRSSKYFNQLPRDKRHVTVCYNRNSATPQQVDNLAAEQCAKYQRTARFLRTTYGVCPLTTVVGSLYFCEGGEDRMGSGGTPVPAGSGTYNWSYTGPTTAPLLPPVPER